MKFSICIIDAFTHNNNSQSAAKPPMPMPNSHWTTKRMMLYLSEIKPKRISYDIQTKHVAHEILSASVFGVCGLYFMNATRLVFADKVSSSRLSHLFRGVLVAKTSNVLCLFIKRFFINL